MKYIKTIFIGLMALVLTASCDVMDTNPFESYSEDLVWGTYETAEAFVMKTYVGTTDYFSGNSAYWESRTPNGAMCDQVGNSIDGVATEKGVDRFTDYGFGRFADQRNCNMIIEKVAASTALTDPQKTRLIAEGHFLRGVLYFDMTRKMGRFVPVTKILTPDDTLEFDAPLTASVAESYDYVMADLDKAIEGLPETSISGRANKYVALALRSRAALQAYAYTMDAKYLDIAINSAEAVINSGKYTLTSNYGGLFNEESPTDAEIIMAHYFLDSDTNVGSFPEMVGVMPNIGQEDVTRGSKDGEYTLDPAKKTFEGWAVYWPTQDLIDQYLVIDEVSNKAVIWYESSQITENVEFLSTSEITSGSIETFTRKDDDMRHIPTPQDMNTDRTDYTLFKYNLRVRQGTTRDISELMYSARDKRMDATIARDRSSLQNETIETNMGGNLSQGIRSKEDGGWYNTTTGYYWKKNTVIPGRIFWSEKINFHFVIARLGEMYMNLAEAYLLKNEVTNAVKALNATRVKHGELPPSEATTIAEAWTDYIRERRVEMAYESGDLYFSYLRWGKYGSYSNHGLPPGAPIVDLGAPIYKISISSDRKAALIGQLTLLNSWDRRFTTKRYLFPIPQGSLDKRAASGIIDQQNEGW